MHIERKPSSDGSLFCIGFCMAVSCSWSIEVSHRSRVTKHVIPRSRQNPKILWVDDAEIVGDRIAKFWPAFGDFFAQEIERRLSEFAICGVSLAVRQMLVHQAPQPFDRVQMRAVSRHEMQRDARPGCASHSCTILA